MKQNRSHQFKTLMWLVRREYWQNRGLLLWGPAAIALGFFLMFLLIEFFWKDILRNEQYSTLQQMFGVEAAQGKLIEYTRSNVSGMSRFILQSMLVITSSFSTLYLFGALRDERQDRSILFWKSMPVSDTLEVLSKLVFPLLLSPILTLLIAFASYFFAALIVACATLFSHFDLFSAVLFNESMYSLPLQYLRLLPFYMAWSLPCVAWFLLVSVWSKSRVFPWAVGIPVLLTLMIAFATDSGWFAKHVAVHWVAGNIPSSWVIEFPREMLTRFPWSIEQGMLTPELLNAAAWYSTQSFSLLIGVVIGIALLVLTIRQRRFAALI
ncbi:hypothetical protein RF679_13185 [Undibacterium cyanobacteriorum]|uniref:ABC transporter permease n=1 Tax=Undibacterium cyanobacteriorum TaxID=3073561 RepID=A0ABY9RH42_9BURK|nr:hypothetical protein [Undibacterium sp. 20NA77.5]WMW79600.1 hypothetical protein RF679_13185 [Undibacterium sp. 20NA77.5]